MFGKRQINLQLTQRTKAFVDRFKLTSNLTNPILGITWSRVSDEPNERWTLGLYERQDVHEGWLGVAPEFDFVAIQEWIFDELENRTLDFDNATGLVTLSPIERL